MPEAPLVRAGTRLRTIPFLEEGAVERYQRRRFRLGPQRIVDLRERAIVREAVRSLARNHRGGQPVVLDVPCGFGRFLGLLGSERIRTIGADLSWAQARRASSHAPAIAGNLLAGLPFSNSCFDMVMCVRLLHHLHDARDRAEALRELARVSRRYVLVSYYGTVTLWRWHRHTLEVLSLKRPRVAVVSRADLLVDAHSAELTMEREWPVLPWVHAHRFALLRRLHS